MAEQKIQVVYHPCLGRANAPIRMLEEAGIEYEFHQAVPGPHATKFVAFGGSGKNFAPPYIKDGDVVITQTTAIIAYLGRRCGFDKAVPVPEVAYQYMCDLADYQTEQFKNWSDPVKFFNFNAGRGKKFLQMINTQIQGPFYFGAEKSYVDFFLMAIFDWAQACVFDKLGQDAAAGFPKIAGALAGIRALESYKNHSKLSTCLARHPKSDEYIAAYKAAGDKDTKKWVVYYYPSFSGRGHAIEAMLSFAGQQYTLKGKDEMIKDSNHTCFAPAAVGRGKKVISQLAASMQYLGDELNMAPPANLAPEALKCALDIADIWSEMYSKRKGFKTWEEADVFVNTRLNAWFTCLNHSAETWSGTGPYFFGSSPTYVDFQLYNMMRNFDFCYGPTRVAQIAKIAPKVAAISAKIHEDPKLIPFLATESKRPILYKSVHHSEGKMPF